eukprot:419203-Ditylum_brightwellii.AAC.1
MQTVKSALPLIFSITISPNVWHFFLKHLVKDELNNKAWASAFRIWFNSCDKTPPGTHCRP